MADDDFAPSEDFKASDVFGPDPAFANPGTRAQVIVSPPAFIEGAGLGASSAGGLLAFRTRYDQALEARRQAAGASETAELCWGGDAKDRPVSTGGGFQIKDSKDKKKGAAPQNDKDNRFEYRERYRFTEKYKVASEDDPETFVIAERMIAMLAGGSDGKVYLFNFTPKSKNKKTWDEGKAPGSVSWDDLQSWGLITRG